MKKLLFSAVAIIAFSGISMANVQKINQQEFGIDSKAQEIIETEATECQDKAIDLYFEIMDNYNNGGDDVGLLNDLLNLCN